MNRRITYGILLCMMASSCVAEHNIVLERPQKERLAKQYKAYNQKKVKETIKKGIAYGASGLAIAGTATALGLWAYYGKKKAKQATVEESSKKQTEDTQVTNEWLFREYLRIKKKKSNLWNKIRVEVAVALIVALCLPVIKVGQKAFLAIINKVLYGSGKGRDGYLAGLTMILDTYLKRIQLAAAQIQDYENNQPFLHLYMTELCESYAVFIRTLEEFSAVFLWELEHRFAKNKAIYVSGQRIIHRLFTFCTATAESLEKDLNTQTGKGLSPESISLVTGLKAECAGVVQYFAGLKG